MPWRRLALVSDTRRAGSVTIRAMPSAERCATSPRAALARGGLRPGPGKRAPPFLRRRAAPVRDRVRGRRDAAEPPEEADAEHVEDSDHDPAEHSLSLRYLVCGNPRSTFDVAGSGHREVTTFPRV